MKNIYRLFVLMVMTLPLVSCDDYEDYNEERPTIIGFSGVVGNSNVNIAPGVTSEKLVNVFVSDVSGAERSFEIEVDEENEIPTENFTFNNQIVIPANERRAQLTITITNVSLPEESSPLVLKIVDSPSYLTGGKARLLSRSN